MYQGRNRLLAAHKERVKKVKPVSKEEQVRELRKKGYLLREICEITGLSYSLVQKYAKGVK